MDQSRTVKLAFWRGVILGPLAVFPATILAAFANTVLRLDSLSFVEALQASIMVSIWGICIAYLAIATFGTAVWYVLWRIQRLSLVPLLLASVLPAALIAVFTKDFAISALVAYYSLAVCFTGWFVGL